ncbi:MAG: peptidoglycan DD-metalloendopeptidase family protein [Gammaproteobacteria bacterium]|nr:peptidoglycan DD-metalloendopeptidase family protein [Gammaproteobacteria bacterium]MDH5801833.1 peptidoglycan DD-metalloendopeptidase family protein [Gammaproteobacteria bacterium]
MKPVIRHFTKAIIITALLLLLTPTVVVAVVPKANPVPGGVAWVSLGHSSDKPQAYFGKNPVMVVPIPGKTDHWRAVTGIPLDTKPGQHQLRISRASGDSVVSFKIKNKKYKKQYLKIKNKRKVDPNPEDLKRILSEKEEITASLAHWRDAPPSTEDFQIPVHGRLSSPFGLRRFFNQKPRKPHSGIDIAAPHGTPIVAPAAAVVLQTGDYFFNGNTVFLDHGNGLITMYCHMSRIDVKPGDTIERGQQIGAIGKTGRATGPHLHWGVSLNDARVDPGLFFDDIRKQVRRKHAKK